METNSIQNAFINALLADATYVENLTNLSGIPLSGQANSKSQQGQVSHFPHKLN
jgi:hypothetical protein